MTERPLPYHPHLWVPYGLDDAEICTLCGEFLTPDNGDEDCPEAFPDIEDEPPEMPAPADQAEPPDGEDDEQRQGATTPP